MGTGLSNHIMIFVVYTLAMIGVIFIAFAAYKFAVINKGKNPVSGIKIEEMTSLGSRKALYIVRVGSERFLIASDADRTTLLSKLQDEAEIRRALEQNIAEAQMEAISEGILTAEEAGEQKKSGMRNLLKELTRKSK
jgi:flagellar biogenesis protein FliO